MANKVLPSRLIFRYDLWYNLTPSEVVMIERQFYIEKIRPFIDKNIIKVLVGIRRSGKSFIMKMVKQLLLEMGIDQTRIIEANFESKALPFDKIADGLYAYVKDCATR